MSTVETGQRGEDAAVAFLKKRGYRIIVRNYRTRYGELDIIARHRKTLVFVEVKTRHGDEFGRPEEAVTPRKLATLERCAQVYLLESRSSADYRFEVVSVMLSPALSIELIPIE